ncbi:primosomal replication protein N [Saezia sanguinis]|uniref:primosomal replication protein N n=1 Tax=Saezia sanguinis TaxID=1965230 RepID=UPI00303A5DBB
MNAIDTIGPGQGVNQCHLQARIESLGSDRYTPAGILALDLVLAHQSSQMELGSSRQVVLSIKAVAFGEVAQKLRLADMQSVYVFDGFLASRGRTQQVILHISDFQSI